jgi:hypothetical protein
MDIFKVMMVYANFEVFIKVKMSLFSVLFFFLVVHPTIKKPRINNVRIICFDLNIK